MKIKDLQGKLTEQEKDRYSLAYMSKDGTIVYIDKFIKDEETGTLIFLEESTKISVENTIKFINRLSKIKVCISRNFVNEIKTIVSVILSDMEQNNISYEEVYDRLHGVEKALKLMDKTR